MVIGIMVKNIIGVRLKNYGYEIFFIILRFFFGV